MVASEYSGVCWELVGERFGRAGFWVLDAEVVRSRFWWGWKGETYKTFYLSLLVFTKVLTGCSNL